MFFALVAFDPVFAETHALLLTISEYRGDIPYLEGVAQDVESARIIARRMGVKEKNIRHYKDNDLTLEGMRKAFDDLFQRIQDNDQVFIYYSGHGGRQLIKDPEERCAESLITVEGRSFVDSELEQKLTQLSSKAQKLVVFLDSCHSGGVTSRSIAGRKPMFSPKYYARGNNDACERPVNVLTRSLNARSRSVGGGAQNYVYIAAARDNEVSLDAPKGGVATLAWRECISGAAQDRDGSGALSAEEIQACAQERINNMVKDMPGFLPHHVSITGNAKAVLAFPETPASTSIQPSKPGDSSTIGGQRRAYNTLLDIFSSRDDRRTVSLRGVKPAFKVGQDNIEFVLGSSHGGHAYILMVGTESEATTFDLLFPNQLDTSNYIEAGESIRLPRASWRIRSRGPAGTNYLLAIVADSPRDFSKLGMRPAGPFSIIAANATSSKDIQLVSGTTAYAESSECTQRHESRNLQLQRRCSNAYGAQLMVLEEVK
jgi:hypothetical protein